jgi:hypothetical protein
MSNALGDRSSTKILTAEQLGTPSNHIAVAYIDSIIPAPPFTEDLQATCNIGNTTTTDIDLLGTGTLNVSGTGNIVVATGDITATAGDIDCLSGDITATTGDVKAGADVTAGAAMSAVTTVTAGTGVIATTGDITAATGKIETTVGDINSGGNIDANGFIRAINGNILAAAGEIYTDNGDIYTDSSGDIKTKGTGNIISATGYLEATAGDVKAGAAVTAATTITAGTGVTATAGGVTATAGDITATAGDVVATAGNLTASAGTMTSQVLKVSNFIDGSTGHLSPQLPPFTTMPDMTGKTKGCFWIYGTTPTIQFIVETGITNVCLNASTYLTFNQFNTANPRFIEKYRIGQQAISGAGASQLVVSVTFDTTVVSTDPIRVCILVLPDV